MWCLSHILSHLIIITLLWDNWNGSIYQWRMRDSERLGNVPEVTQLLRDLDSNPSNISPNPMLFYHLIHTLDDKLYNQHRLLNGQWGRKDQRNRLNTCAIIHNKFVARASLIRNRLRPSTSCCKFISEYGEMYTPEQDWFISFRCQREDLSTFFYRPLKMIIYLKTLNVLTETALPRTQSLCYTPFLSKYS